ncbi:MAG: hypothetical protein AAF844_12890, partial [Pseudomonadota bacterium]
MLQATQSGIFAPLPTNNRFDGGSGNDQINARDGDTAIGGTGDDKLNGGSTVVFRNGDGNDTVRRFDVDSDELVFERVEIETIRLRDVSPFSLGREEIIETSAGDTDVVRGGEGDDIRGDIGDGPDRDADGDLLGVVALRDASRDTIAVGVAPEVLVSRGSTGIDL